LMDDFTYRKSVLRIVDRGREKLLPRQLAEALMQLRPAVDTARHGHRLNSILRHRTLALTLEEVDGEGFGRPSAGVDAGEFAGLGSPNNARGLPPRAGPPRVGPRGASVWRRGRRRARGRRAPAPARPPAMRASGWWRQYRGPRWPWSAPANDPALRRPRPV